MIMEKKSYSVGFLKETLAYDTNFIIYSIPYENGGSILIHFSRHDHSFLLLRNNEIIPDNLIAKGVKLRLSEDGSRWEGDSLIEKPVGFGNIYDGEGNRIYTGYMVNGKKIGFGTEYFADSHTIDYSGTFMNDRRHGWGITYDKNGNVSYEGEWRCGKNRDFDKVVIEDNYEVEDDGWDCWEMHDLVKEILIGKNCLNNWGGSLGIENYPNLDKIVVKKDSLRNLDLLKICNNEKLKTIEIEDGEDEESTFCNVKNVIIESISIRLFYIFKSS